ncbi:MAG: hypothetical protein PHG31_04100 [Candidatus Omnitrophica bacterium]|nr:hypothetical protein [Candidatus Omnitrophota bacterium]
MNRKAQIAPFILVVAVVLMLAIVATALIGESTFTRVRLANTADGALITAGSNFCKSLNQLRKVNKQLFLNYLSLQTTLLAHGVWWGGKLEPLPIVGLGVAQNLNLFNFAENEIAAKMPKDLRVSVYEAILAAGLVDEPTPFLKNEVIVDPISGETKGLDYNRYIARMSSEGTQFSRSFRDFKVAHSSNWFNNNIMSYSFDKFLRWNINNITGESTIANPGAINPGEPLAGYQSFVRVQLLDMPTNVDIKPQVMVMIFLWYCPTPWGGIVLPGFYPHTHAWIRRISFGNNNTFGANVSKRVVGANVPFVGRNADITHTSRVRIVGNVWQGYDVRLQE